METDTTALIARVLPRGNSRVHLVAEGEPNTLCGLSHRMNPKYAYSKFYSFGNLPAEAANCPKCEALR